MSDGVISVEKLQAGMETAHAANAGTFIVPAEGGGAYSPDIQRVPIPDIIGVAAETDDLDVVKGSGLVIANALDFENILLPLLAGLDEIVPTGADPYVWLFEPSLVAPPDVQSATFEIGYWDGTSSYVDEEINYAVCTGFSIEGGFATPAKISASYIGRYPDAAGGVTAAQAVLARETVASGKFGVYADSAWTGLGTTQLSGLVKSFKLEVDTGIKPKYALDARPNLDFSGHNKGVLTGSLELECWVNADAATRYANWKAKTREFISLEVAGSGTSLMTLGGCFEYIENPTPGDDDGIRTMTFKGGLRHDPTSGKALSISVTNSLATF